MATSRNLRKRGKIENEIEKLRSEGKFIKAIDLIAPHKTDSHLAILHYLVSCELKLESFEDDCITEPNLKSADTDVDKALQASDDHYKLEASVLRCKILYIRRKFSDALNRLKMLDTDMSRIDSYAMHSTRISSEGMALIGLCIEEVAQMTRRPLSETERNDAYLHYELASEICIRHSQDVYENSDHTIAIRFPKLVFKAVQRMLHLTHQKDDIHETVNLFRYLMRFRETPSTRPLRQALACQFADLLLRAVSVESYLKYDMAQEKSESKLSRGLPIPHRYFTSKYIPDSLYREAILMILISERIANEEVVLNRPTEMAESRIMKSVNNTSAVYDLLAIALARTGNYAFLSKSLERSLKFSYREFHIWYQFGLSLISARKYYRGYLVLCECMRLDPNCLSVYLLAISLCFDHLGLLEDGIDLCHQAIEVARSASDPVLCGRTHLMHGWGLSLLARTCRVTERKQDLQNQAVNAYNTAVQLDPDDYLSWYHLAVELATQRQLDKALAACQHSLYLMPAHSNTLCLLSLLHSAGGKRMDQAAKVLKLGLIDRPKDLNLYCLLAKIEAYRQGTKAGLLIYRRALEVWRQIFSSDYSSTSGSYDDQSMFGSLQTNIIEIDDEPILGPTSLTGSGYLITSLSQMALGQIGQSGSSITPFPRNFGTEYNRIVPFSPPVWYQAKIYIGLTELYLEGNQLNEAQEALDETVRLLGLNLHALYLRGRLAEKQNLLTKARSIYESVISIDSSHMGALLSLADLLLQMDQVTLAERTVRDALQLDATNCEVWQLLAEILQSSNSSEPASEKVVTKALLNAVDFQQSEPLEPFHQLPIGVRCS